MGRPLGLLKTGGRRKGTPNKRSVSLAELLEKRDFEPIGEILNLLPVLSPKEQAGVLLNLLPYLYPKRKSIDLAITQEAPPEQIDDSPEARKDREIQIRRLMRIKLLCSGVFNSDQTANEFLDKYFPLSAD